MRYTSGEYQVSPVASLYHQTPVLVIRSAFSLTCLNSKRCSNSFFSIAVLLNCLSWFWASSLKGDCDRMVTDSPTIFFTSPYVVMMRNSRCLILSASSFSLIDSTSSGWMMPFVPLKSCGNATMTLLQNTASDAKSQYQLPESVMKLGSKKIVTVL